MTELPSHTKVPPPTLREYWLLLDSYDWEGYRRFLEEGLLLPREWHQKHDPIQERIIDIADESDEHAKLAAAFEHAMLNLESRPPQPV